MKCLLHQHFTEKLSTCDAHLFDVGEAIYPQHSRVNQEGCTKSSNKNSDEDFI